MTKTLNVAARGEREIVMIRVFEAPRELVFRAFTEIEMALHWMGPREFPMTHLEGDLRVGGKWRGCLKAADGRELWQGGEWREVVAPERLAFTFGWEQPDGSRGPETLITITLAEQGGKPLILTLANLDLALLPEPGRAARPREARERLSRAGG